MIANAHASTMVRLRLKSVMLKDAPETTVAFWTCLQTRDVEDLKLCYSKPLQKEWRASA